MRTFVDQGNVLKWWRPGQCSLTSHIGGNRSVIKCRPAGCFCEKSEIEEGELMWRCCISRERGIEGVLTSYVVEFSKRERGSNWRHPSG